MDEVNVVLRLVPAGKAVLPVGPHDGAGEALGERSSHRWRRLDVPRPPVLAAGPGRNEVAMPVARLSRRGLRLLGSRPSPVAVNVESTRRIGVGAASGPEGLLLSISRKGQVSERRSHTKRVTETRVTLRESETSFPLSLLLPPSLPLRREINPTPFFV